MKTIIYTTLFLLILLFSTKSYAQVVVNSKAPTVYYQKCIEHKGNITCSRVSSPTMFSFLKKEDIKVDNCYLRNVRDKQVFFRITKMSGTLIWALAIVIPNSNQSWDGELYHDYYQWGGMNFNNELQKIDCNQAPVIEDMNWVKNNCSFTSLSKMKVYCNIDNPKREIFGERKF